MNRLESGAGVLPTEYYVRDWYMLGRFSFRGEPYANPGGDARILHKPFVPNEEALVSANRARAGNRSSGKPCEPVNGSISFGNLQRLTDTFAMCGQATSVRLHTLAPSSMRARSIHMQSCALPLTVTSKSGGTVRSFTTTATKVTNCTAENSTGSRLVSRRNKIIWW